MTLIMSLVGMATLIAIALLFSTNRRAIARFGLKAVLAGTLSNLMSATLAGFFLALGAMG